MTIRQFALSASSISSFKACPTRYRLAYREGIRPIEDTDSQRRGTNWHALHEVYENELGKARNDEALDYEQASAKALQAAIDFLNDRYADAPMPSYKTIEEWQVEQMTLVASFMAYLNYWGSTEDRVYPLKSEVQFQLPLYTPKVGLPLPMSQVVRQGKIDNIGIWQNKLVNVERKSTTRSIDSSSDYWNKAQKDTQVSMYDLSFHDIMKSEGPQFFGLSSDCELECSGSTLYDVWHVPTIKPSKLTQAGTAELLKTQTYCGQTFDVKVVVHSGFEVHTEVFVDGKGAEVIPGKRGFAVRETPDMYAARLLQDIQERPEFYFQRREISRTDNDRKRFRNELFNIYQAQKMFDMNNCWYENEQQCRATFPCPYIPICYGEGADALCKSKDVPNGFKRRHEDTPVEEDV